MFIYLSVYVLHIFLFLSFFVLSCVFLCFTVVSSIFGLFWVLLVWFMRNMVVNNEKIIGKFLLIIVELCEIMWYYIGIKISWRYL